MSQKSLDTCDSCKKSVYPFAKLTDESKVYHRFCFKCSICDSGLQIGKANILNDKLYCSQHFIQESKKGHETLRLSQLKVVENNVVGPVQPQTSKTVTIEPSFIKASIEEKTSSEENPLPTPMHRSASPSQHREDHVISRSGSSDKVSSRNTSVESVEKLHNVENKSSDVVKQYATSNSQDEETNSKSGTSPSFMENFSRSERDMLIQINAHDKSTIQDPSEMNAKQSPLQRDGSSHSDSGSVEVETLMKQVEELTKELEAYKYKAKLAEERANRLERSLGKMLEVVKEYRGLNPKLQINEKEKRDLPPPTISVRNRIDTKSRSSQQKKETVENSVKLIGLYDYESQYSDDLPFAEGDIMTLLKKYKTGWWLVELNGRVGRVPANFVEELEEQFAFEVVALVDHSAEQEGDISFKKGDTFKILKKQENDWWIGKLDNGETGFVRSIFVKELKG